MTQHDASVCNYFHTAKKSLQIFRSKIDSLITLNIKLSSISRICTKEGCDLTQIAKLFKPILELWFMKLSVPNPIFHWFFVSGKSHLCQFFCIFNLWLSHMIYSLSVICFRYFGYFCLSLDIFFSLTLQKRPFSPNIFCVFLYSILTILLEAGT